MRNSLFNSLIRHNWNNLATIIFYSYETLSPIKILSEIADINKMNIIKINYL